MYFRQPLNQVLTGEVAVRLLRFFCHKGGEWSGRRLAREIGVHPTTAHHALRQLRQATIVEFKRVGSSFVYSLHDEHLLVRELLRPLFQREAQLLEQVAALVRAELPATLRGAVVTVAVYGSVARGQERATSDLDLLVLVRSLQAKPAVHAAFERMGARVMRACGNSLAVYVNTVQEARQKVRKGFPVFHSILAHHQVLWGRPLQEVLHGR
jgi:DNA-binding transcriptional ArsR family regulator